MKYLLTVFMTIFLAEIGDKTQFAVLLFSTNENISKLGVALAASLALITATLIAVALGDRLSRLISPQILEGIAGAGFIIIGMLMLISLWHKV